MTEITVELTGYNEAILHIQQWGDAVKERVISAVKEEARRLQARLQDEVLPSLPIRQGKTFKQLQKAVNSEFQESSTSIVATVGSEAVYPKLGSEFNLVTALEFGTAAHEIRAKNATALRFVIGGAVFFRKRVMHPGTKAYHPYENTFTEERPNIVAKIARASLDEQA